MKLTEFHIRNFRSLRDVHLGDLENLNVLIGKNSSGKSNILEGLSLLFENFSVTGGVTTGLVEYMWFNRRTQDPIEFTATLSLDENEVAAIFPKDYIDYMRSTRQNVNEISFSRKVLGVQGDWKTDYLKWGGLTLILEDRRLSPEEAVNSVSDAPAQKPDDVTGAPQFTPQILGETTDKIAQKVRGRFKLISAARDMKSPAVPQRTTLVDSQIQDQLWRWDQSIGESEQETYGGIESAFADVTDMQLDLAAGQVYVKRPKRFPIASEGGGVQASLNMIFYLKSESQSNFIFAIEEPESHSHFEYQRQLFNVIRKFAENSQVFVSTHSPVFVDRSEPRNTWLVKNVGNETTVERVSELREVLDEIGARLSDVFFFAGRIIFVEGQSDEIIVRAFARKAGKDLTDVLIIPVKGKGSTKSHLKTWIGITKGTIPFYLILDADAQQEAEDLVKAGQLKPAEYHVWKRGAIEEYYPPKILQKALQDLGERYRVDIDANKLMKQVDEGKLKQSEISAGDKENVLDGSWKVVLAEQVSNLLEKGTVDLQDEVLSVLNDALPQDQ
jgi:putative ATP-dependent endonuclease of the OLD family